MIDFIEHASWSQAAGAVGIIVVCAIIGGLIGISIGRGRPRRGATPTGKPMIASPADPYPEQRANARRWLNQQRAIGALGDHWILATPQPKRPFVYVRGRLEFNEAPALCRPQGT